MSSQLRIAARAAMALSLFVPAMFAADTISDADERFRIKFGTYPPHVQQSRNRTADAFARIDANGDGRLSRQEWKKDGRCKCQFEDRDHDGDGHITRSEWKAEQSTEKSGS